ncbi:MAG: nucleotidyl transferase AbiEii/AbiGii toxin family protein [Methanosarcinales archaeon]|nr:nucleotidyl transferase AbiEii/AbiGii toxin family protein [Methanosarcinales archaeon]
MIRANEIRETAREHGVPESTIEKDYCIGWLLKSMYQPNDSFVLKGGTGIRKLYIRNYRFSEDLDFTMQKKMGKAKIEEIIRTAIQTAREDSGIGFLDDIKSVQNTNGYRFDVYFRILRQTGNPLRIKFDLTKPEQERVILPIRKMPVLHPYSDKCSAAVLAYSIHEIISEKIRAIFERTRPRDLYDIWYFSENFVLRQALDILPEKCNFKAVKMDILSVLERKDDFSTAWDNSLGHQLKDLPDFEMVFEQVMKQLKTMGTI